MHLSVPFNKSINIYWKVFEDFFSRYFPVSSSEWSGIISLRDTFSTSIFRFNGFFYYQISFLSFEPFQNQELLNSKIDLCICSFNFSLKYYKYLQFCKGNFILIFLVYPLNFYDSKLKFTNYIWSLVFLFDIMNYMLVFLDLNVYNEYLVAFAKLCLYYIFLKCIEFGA